MKRVLHYLAAIFLVLFIGGLAIDSIGPIPDNAIVYVDDDANTYYSPLGLNQEKVTALNLKHTTLKVAQLYGYKVSEEDKQNGYFMQEGRSLTGAFLEKVGILPELMDRVDADGNWRY